MLDGLGELESLITKQMTSVNCVVRRKKHQIIYFYSAPFHGVVLSFKVVWGGMGDTSYYEGFTYLVAWVQI